MKLQFTGADFCFGINRHLIPPYYQTNHSTFSSSTTEGMGKLFCEDVHQSHLECKLQVMGQVGQKKAGGICKLCIRYSV
jgi:hypothetical protein